MSTMTVSTAQVIADMLTEPTGASILDSGSAYGRNWQRNQGKELAYWEGQPSATVDRWGCVTVSVFHYLTERVRYAADLDEDWQHWAAVTDPDDKRGWLDLATEWAERMDTRDPRAELTEPRTWNTYNGEDMLSQVLQGVTFCYDPDGWGGAVYVLLQIHGGCDVRGGYTRPRVFKVITDMPEYFPYDNADATVYCPGEDCGRVWDIRGGYDITDRDGCPTELPEPGDDGMTCPDCGAVLAADGAAAY